MGKINWGFKVKISTSRLKEIIREEVQKANEMSRLKEGWCEDLSDKAHKSYIKKHGEAPNSSGKKEDEMGDHIRKAISKGKKGQEKMKKLNRDWDAKTSTASDIAKDMGGNMTGAVKKIEKIKKGLSDDPKVKAALRAANESINEGRKWTMYVDDKKIKTHASKRAAVIAYNKFIKDTDDWKEVSIQAESVNEATSSKDFFSGNKVTNSLPRATLSLLNSKLNKASEAIIKITDKYKKQGDIDELVKIWMRGLHLRLKKGGIKIESVNEARRVGYDKSYLDNAKKKLKVSHEITDIEYKKTRQHDKFVKISYKLKWKPGTRLDTEEKDVNVFYDSPERLKMIGKTLKLKLKESVNEKVAKPFSEHLRKAQDEIEYMISNGPTPDGDDGVYDRPNQAMKLLQIAQKSLGKIK